MAYNDNIKSGSLREWFPTLLPNGPQWCIHSGHTSSSLEQTDVPFLQSTWSLDSLNLRQKFLGVVCVCACVCTQVSRRHSGDVLQNVFLCHETDASYSHHIIWHMKDEIIWGDKPPGIVTDDSLVGSNSKPSGRCSWKSPRFHPHPAPKRTRWLGKWWLDELTYV